MYGKRTVSKIAEEDDGQVPSCTHGPAIKFNRTRPDGSTRAFFACAAVRDRKECPLFHWVDDWGRLLKRRTQVEPAVRRKLTPSAGLGEEFLANAESGSASQFFFDEKTQSRICQLIGILKPSRILCIGCPSISRNFPGSVLLDIDDRLPDVKKFNMFSGHFFNYEDEDFVKNEKFDLVICDPPFQPELLKRLNTSIKQFAPEAHVLLAFPCFNKDAVFEALGATMTDLRLGYENHRKYKGDKSPVRLYTTLKQADLPLPEDDYVKCEPCGRYVHKLLNKHCSLCNACPTIHGNMLYKHCKTCGKCVKPGLKHCMTCKRCLSEDHQCLDH